MTMTMTMTAVMIRNEEEAAAAKSNDDLFRWRVSQPEKSVTFNGNPPSTPHLNFGRKREEGGHGGLFETS